MLITHPVVAGGRRRQLSEPDGPTTRLSLKDAVIASKGNRPHTACMPHQLKEQRHSRDLQQNCLAEVKNRLSEYVSEVEQTHDRMTISRH